MARYTLYVDESGSFRTVDRRSLVCGVLEHDTGELDWDRVRAEVSTALPLVPYPYHATQLHEPAVWVWVALVGMQQPNADLGSRAELIAQATAPAVVLTQLAFARGTAELTLFRRYVEWGRFPPKDVLKDYRAWLAQQSPAAFSALRQLGSTMRRALTRCYKKALEPVSDRLWVVCAVAEPNPTPSSELLANASPGSGYTNSRDAIRVDGYLRALESLIERVLCLLRGGRRCDVDLWVATRRVETVRHGTLAVGRSIVQQIADRARQFPALPTLDGGSRDDVHFHVPQGVVNFDAQSPMGLVLADAVSNHLFHALLADKPRLAHIETDIQQSFSLNCEVAPLHPLASDTLPALTWDGPARAALRAAFAGKPAAVEPLRPQANQLQAQRWCTFANHAWESTKR